jgi:hypothetical protein
MSIDPTVNIGNVGSTICDMDVDVGWSLDPNGPDGTLTLTATSTTSGCSPTVANPSRTVPAQQGAGNESFALTVSGCPNGAQVKLTAKITQGSGSDSVSKTATVDCA